MKIKMSGAATKINFYELKKSSVLSAEERKKINDDIVNEPIEVFLQKLNKSGRHNLESPNIERVSTLKSNLKQSTGFRISKQSDSKKPKTADATQRHKHYPMAEVSSFPSQKIDFRDLSP
jgi:hypothetical protein